MIAASRLTRAFGPRVAVDDVSFTVERGEVVALLGPNGAGKTTTLRMLAGLIAPGSGAVAIDGVPMTRATGPALRRRIGFLTEAPGLWDRLTVRENLMVYGGLYGLDAVADRLAVLVEPLELGPHLEKRAAELSKGMRQKAALARALLHGPDVLLLDEPTSGLDPEMSRTVRALLEERRAAGCAVILSTHNLDEAERMASRVAVVQGKLIALDAPAALRRRIGPGHVTLRFDGPASAHLEAARRVAAGAIAEDRVLQVRLDDADRQTPELIQALAASGARILEVRREAPALEEVYLRLMADGRAGGPR